MRRLKLVSRLVGKRLVVEGKFGRWRVASGRWEEASGLWVATFIHMTSLFLTFIIITVIIKDNALYRHSARFS